MHARRARTVRGRVPGMARLPTPRHGHRVVFCRRADFEAIGGYREHCRWGEDVWFLLDLRRRGWRSGRRLEDATRVPAVFSARKFDRYGDWHYFTMPFPLLWEALRGCGTTAQRYWYGPR